jgi:hypothetical protein
MSEAGRKFCEGHRGAAGRQLAVCLEVLKKTRSVPDLKP